MATIRAAELRDARAIAALQAAAWHATYRGLMPDALLDTLSVDDLQRARTDALARPSEGVRTWLLEGAGELLGFAITGPSRDADLDAARVGEVRAIYLAPDHVGRGLGRRLLDHALADLRARGFVEATLWALEGNERARRFYARAGFAPGGQKLERLSGFDLPHVRWRRALEG